MAHASRALQTHDMPGEGINSGSHTYFLDHTRAWRASSDEGSAQCRVHLRDNKNMKDNAHHSRTHSFWDVEGLKLPVICLTGEENPEKTSSRKLVPTHDRTRARCVTSAHATACSKAVDNLEHGCANHATERKCFCPPSHTVT